MPTMIIAKTLKGKGLPDIEDHENWHGKPVGNKLDELVKHVEDQIVDKEKKFHTIAPEGTEEFVLHTEAIKLPELPYKLGDKVATRFAYGEGLKRLG